MNAGDFAAMVKSDREKAIRHLVILLDEDEGAGQLMAVHTGKLTPMYLWEDEELVGKYIEYLEWLDTEDDEDFYD